MAVALTHLSRHVNAAPVTKSSGQPRLVAKLQLHCSYGIGGLYRLHSVAQGATCRV